MGPIGQALDKREFDEVVLLSDYAKKEGTAYVQWAQQRTSAKVRLRQVELDDPTHFATIYKLADAALSEVRVAAQKNRQALELTLHLSPGTPVMTAVWVILGKAKYPAELIQTSKQRGLQTASVPLDIAAEFLDLIPELLKRSDASLETRSDGTPPAAPQFGDIVYGCKAMAELVGRARSRRKVLCGQTVQWLSRRRLRLFSWMLSDEDIAERLCRQDTLSPTRKLARWCGS